MEMLISQIRAGYRMKQPRQCSLPLYELLRSCWFEDPDRRPSFETIVLKLQAVLEFGLLALTVDGAGADGTAGSYRAAAGASPETAGRNHTYVALDAGGAIAYGAALTTSAATYGVPNSGAAQYGMPDSNGALVPGGSVPARGSADWASSGVSGPGQLLGGSTLPQHSLYTQQGQGSGGSPTASATDPEPQYVPQAGQSNSLRSEQPIYWHDGSGVSSAPQPAPRRTSATLPVELVPLAGQATGALCGWLG